MGEIILVRHGQANSQAKDEASYDKLSDLGHTQAKWLGDYLSDREAPFDRVICGSLRRHMETAAGIGYATPDVDPRLNEMDYFNLGQSLEDVHGVPFPGPDEFAAHVPQVMEAWHRAEIMGVETFASFEDRVTGVLQAAAEPGVRVLCVTSGGVIGMIIRHLLDLDPTRMAHILLPIMNTSLHRVRVIPQGPILASYNAVPHLDHPDRAHAITHY
ncbi:histidine phosphatase family protein [Yoonia sediminilitoris]|uniref:Broad specificity phosphatase PhoE n=1 Tax=Yoonia sediminilitoris TaxID=1286148 RepID=A0A2T6KN50_9RHOB|nr:histidine phosphatase family protein [Yoonia sediminilitoris]PUB17611.1 broad specificity phosphatase PhoE [Yoonia sediminilitoris]RCW97906.1 broad specificity phosphatase PhoE [Yoonia sediminilitoris]